MAAQTKHIKISYIGGGSKEWARVFMTDLALEPLLTGEISLYDIDTDAAERNRKIGQRINNAPETISKWNYTVALTLEQSLHGADFVVISILPGTFEEMRSDVHEPEKYGIYQSVGDTVGPGGILRAMRTVPLYEKFARAIKEQCPDAWIINLTNPMAMCVKTLYDVFPQIKAFGCCHEVFHTQKLLCCMLEEETGIKASRADIYTDVSGANHFTWVTKAFYKDADLLEMFARFTEKHFISGYYENGSPELYKTDPFAYANRVKMDMFMRYGVLPFGGDRHLVEFMNNSWYLASKETIDYWKFALTTVDYRVASRAQRIEKTIAMAEGREPVIVKKSDEEVVDLMKALLGLERRVSNVNLPNRGQMPFVPEGFIVETNAVFSNNQAVPVTASPLPAGPRNLVMRNLYNIETAFQGIKERNLDIIFESFMNQPLCSNLSIDNGRKLFKTMIENTKMYLKEYFRV